MHNKFISGYTVWHNQSRITAESEASMDKKEEEQYRRQENLNQFNSITRKVKPENQNQEHNVRKEGIGPINQKR